MSRLTRVLSAAFLAATLFGPLLPEARCQTTAPGTERFPLRIFYAGKPGSAREADFLTFLKQHFRQVNTGDLASFNPRQATDTDVILFDYDGDGFKAPRPNLPAGYARPTVTIGVAGGLFCSQRGLKTGYM